MSKKKILVVDDNAFIVKTLSMKLAQSGYDVLGAQDGSAAVNIARAEKPDLILLDIGFPPEVGSIAWDGFRIMDWLRQMEEAKHIPIIMISRNEAAQSEERALAAGAVAFFHKPIDNPKLLAAISKILSPKTASE